jgi:hypothetical protein
MGIDCFESDWSGGLRSQVALVASGKRGGMLGKRGEASRLGDGIGELGAIVVFF